MSTNRERRISRLLTIHIVLMLTLQKIAFHIGTFEFSLAFFSFPILLIQMSRYKAVKANRKRILLYFAMIISTLFSMLINTDTFKFSSYLLFVILYVEVCFDFRLSDYQHQIISNCFSKVLLLAGIIGIVQFAVQIIGLPFFDLFDLLPKSIKLSGFNTYYAVSYGSKFIKSNGWFFLEPSFFSQYMALGVIIVLSHRVFDKKAIASLVVFGLGIICSFSGTGILLLIVAIIPALKKLNFSKRVLVIIGVISAIVIFSQSPFFYAVSDRIFEYRTSGSSSAIRFINPYVVAFGSQRQAFFFGNGAGMADGLKYIFQVNHNAITKVMVEYGFATLLLFVPLIVKVFTRNRLSLISISVLLMFLFLSGNLLQPSVLFLLYLFVEIESKQMSR